MPKALASLQQCFDHALFRLVSGLSPYLGAINLGEYDRVAILKDAYSKLILYPKPDIIYTRCTYRCIECEKIIDMVEGVLFLPPVVKLSVAVFLFYFFNLERKLGGVLVYAGICLECLSSRGLF